MSDKKIAWDVVYAAVDLMTLTVSAWLSFRAPKKGIRIIAAVVATAAVLVMPLLPLYD